MRYCRLSLRREDVLGIGRLVVYQVVNRGEEKVRVHTNVVPRSTVNTNGGTENLL